MNENIWFYNPRLNSGELARQHRAAYEKSLKSRHAVKVHSGTYYYRGFEVSKDGGRDCPWCYNRPDASDFDKGWAETKALALAYVDDILKEDLYLCDIMCR